MYIYVFLKGRHIATKASNNLGIKKQTLEISQMHQIIQET